MDYMTLYHQEFRAREVLDERIKRLEIRLTAQGELAETSLALLAEKEQEIDTLKVRLEKMDEFFSGIRELVER
jgi:uncharacterized coiled-coil protein SlyX